MRGAIYLIDGKKYAMRGAAAAGIANTAPISYAKTVLYFHTNGLKNWLTIKEL